MKNSEVISRVVNAVRGLTKDEHISKRYVLNVLQTKARIYMLTKMATNELLKVDGLVSTIKCLKLIPVTKFQCDIIEFKLCKDLMKSEKKLPEILGGKHGLLILSVSSVDGEHIFRYSSPYKYRNDKDRTYSKFIKDGIFYVEDGYLYIPDSEIEAVNVTIIGLSKSEIAALSGCGEADTCSDIYEEEFICPDKLIDFVIADAITEVMNSWKIINIDEQPNLNENIK